MTVIYLGSRSIGESIPGLTDALATTGEAVRYLRREADGAIGQIGVAVGLLTSAISDIESAKDGLLANARDPVSAAFSTANSLLNQLQNMLDPNLYLSNLIASLGMLAAQLNLLSGAAYLSQQIAGVQAGINSFQAQLAALDAEFDTATNGMTYIGDALAKVTEVSSALYAANAATLGALANYTAMLSGLANSGVHAFGYTGAIGSLGAELDAATPASGVSGGAEIGGVILFAKTADATTLSTLESIFGL